MPTPFTQGLVIHEGKKLYELMLPSVPHVGCRIRFRNEWYRVATIDYIVDRPPVVNQVRLHVTSIEA